MKRFLNVALLLVGLALSFATGCGPDQPAIKEQGEPVSGKVTLKGKSPTTYGSIEFYSVADMNRKTVAGVEPNGNFSGLAPQGKVRAVYVANTPPVNSGGTTKSSSAKDPAKFGIELDIPAGGAKDLVIDFPKG